MIAWMMEKKYQDPQPVFTLYFLTFFSKETAAECGGVDNLLELILERKLECFKKQIDNKWIISIFTK